MMTAIASAAKIEMPFMTASLALCEQEFQSGCARCQCTRRFKRGQPADAKGTGGWKGASIQIYDGDGEPVELKIELE